MDQNARRKIINEKSEYVRKPRKMSFRDKIQFRWLMFKLRKTGNIHYYGVRPLVRIMLRKHGYSLTYKMENCYQIQK